MGHHLAPQKNSGIFPDDSHNDATPVKLRTDSMAVHEMGWTLDNKRIPPPVAPTDGYENMTKR